MKLHTVLLSVSTLNYVEEGGQAKCMYVDCIATASFGFTFDMETMSCASHVLEDMVALSTVGKSATFEQGKRG